ncbi:amidohydrolase family protein [Spirosoma sp. KNUC1025]|uniref:amidohydrolase family protein n=1 Tax=Spirosoma sp. KNUC1025 TaxID=2894082 RepID=UPI00386E04FC|nr:amidohydrolase family protein [Spirosoma sp. KNUC1025]
MRLKLAVLGLLIATLSSTLVCAQKPSSRLTLIRVGKLYDSQTRTFLKNQQILIQNDLIRDIGVKLTIPKGATVIDLAQCTVTPGLIDAHTHLLIEQKTQTEAGFQEASKLPAQQRIEQGLTIARQHLQAGITTVRDLGNSGQYLDIRLQKLLLANKALGPNLYASGPILSPPGGQFGRLFPADSFIIDQEYRVIRGAADAEAAVLDHIQHGVNVIKVCMNTDNRVLAPEEIKAIVTTAHARGIPVTAHATFDESARDAVLAGVDGIEHGYSLSDSTLSLMAERKVYLVPTDVSVQKGKLLVAGIGMKGKEADEYLTTNLNAFHDRLQRAVKKGIMIVSGSDYYNSIKGIGRGDGAIDVLLSYHEAGIPVTDVLGFATRNAATALGIFPQYGSIRKGSKANLVAFEGDLDDNFEKTLSSVRVVFHEGELVYDSTKK